MEIPKKMKISAAEPADAEEIAANYASLIGMPGCTWDEHYPSLEYIKKNIADGSMFKAELDGRIIASAYCGDYEEREVLSCFGSGERLAEFGRVGVVKDFHRKGVAEALLRFLAENAKKRGYSGIALLVGRGNHGAVALYEKLGFERVGESDIYDTEWYCYLLDLTEERT